MDSNSEQEHDFLSFVEGILRTRPGSLSLDTAYGSIPEWDSVMHIRLIMEFGERYGFEIPLERIPDIRTLGDFFNMTKKQAKGER